MKEQTRQEWTFRRLTAPDAARLSPYYELRPTEVCDGTVFDSYLWRSYYEVSFCIRDGRAVEWRMQTKGEPWMAMPLCRAEELSYYFADCRRYMNEVKKRPLTLLRADEAAVSLLEPELSRFRVEEAEGWADYIYEAEALRTLAGKKYHGKKNHINAFLRDYEGRFCYRPLSCLDREEILRFLTRWETRKGEAVGPFLQAEIDGLEDVLAYCSLLPARMGGIFVDGQLEAFSIGTYNRPRRMAIIHIEKANAQIRGLYPYINQRFLQEAFPEAVWVNREDDAGMPGLRQAKLSYHPAKMGRKFNIYEE